MPTQHISPTSPEIQSLINLAITDLAQHLGVSPEEIQLVGFESVVWPDSSLGCPQMGMAYKQVPQDGYRITLAFQKQSFNYHGGSGRGPFLCELDSSAGTPPPLPGLGAE